MKKIVLLFALLLSLYSGNAQPGSAINCDGVDDFVDPSILVTFFPNNFTYEAWIRPTATHEIDPQTNSMTIDGLYNQRYLLWPTWRNTEGGIGISVGTNGVSVYEHGNNFINALLVWSGTISGWTHIAITVMNKQPKLYVNGVLAATGLTSNKANVYASLGACNQYPGQVGGIGGGTYGYYEGDIDEFRIWKTVRTVTEIQANMNAEFNCFQPDLFAYYKFNQGIAGGSNPSVTSATDFSGNNYTGALNNFALAGVTSNWVSPGGVVSGSGGVPIVPKYYYDFENYFPNYLTNPNCYHNGSPSYYDKIRSQVMRCSVNNPPVVGQVGNCRSEYIPSGGFGPGCHDYCWYLDCSCNCTFNCYGGCYISGHDQSQTNGFSAEFLIKPDITAGNSWGLSFDFNLLASSLPNVVKEPYINLDQGVIDFGFYDVNDPAYPGPLSYHSIQQTFTPASPGIYSGSYLEDGNWHHLAFVYDGVNNKMQIWIDAVLLPGMSVSLPANTKTYFPDNLTANFASKYTGVWDEFAVYDKALTPELIYQHYMDMKAGNHYSYCTNYTSADLPPVPVASCPLLNSNESSPNPVVDVDKQLFSFPLPRYMQGHNLKPNFPWTDIKFLAYKPFPTIDITTLLNLNQERARKWNYYYELTPVNTDISAYGGITPVPTPGQLGYEWLKQACTLDQYPASSILFESYTSHVTLSPLGVAQSAAMNVGPNPGPMEMHGQSVGTTLNNNLVKYINSFNTAFGTKRRLDIINMDEESFFPLSLTSTPSTAGTLQKDLDKKFQKGLFDPGQYLNPNDFPVQNTKFSRYRVGSYDDGLFEWTKDATAWKYPTLDVYTSPTHWNDGNPASHGLQTFEKSRNMELSTPTPPQLCSPFVSANYNADESYNMTASQYLAACKLYAMLGAEFYYVSYFNECKTARVGTPLSWSGTTCAWPNAPGSQVVGGILYVTSPGTPNDPRQYLYQVAMPSYAQAITSRYEDILRSSYLLNGINSLYPTNYKYRFSAGNEPVYVRQYYVGNTTPANLYVINGAIMLSNNCAGIEPNEKKQTIKMPDWATATEEITFNIRRQGSTYIYDKRDPNNILFFQLDKWHEVTHPYNWSKDFTFEAELYDDNQYTSTANNVKLKTEVPASTPAGDFTNSTTFIRYPSGSAKKTHYHFEPRDQNNIQTGVTYYLWVRARRNSDASTPPGMSSMDVIVKRENSTNPNVVHPPTNTPVLAKTTIPCIDNSGFKWYSLTYIPSSLPPVMVSFVAQSTHTHKIEFTANDDYVEFDQFILTTSPTPPAAINPGDVVTICPIAPGSRMAPPAQEDTESETSGAYVYPSPSTGEFNISLEDRNEKIQEISVKNMLGQEVYNVKNVNDSKTTISVSSAAHSGVLLVYIRTDARTYKNKVVLVK